MQVVSSNSQAAAVEVAETWKNPASPLSVRPRLDEGRVPNRRAEHHEAALVWRLVTSPHIRSEVGHLGWCWHIGPAEYPCFAVIGNQLRPRLSRRRVLHARRARLSGRRGHPRMRQPLHPPVGELGLRVARHVDRWHTAPERGGPPARSLLLGQEPLAGHRVVCRPAIEGDDNSIRRALHAELGG